MSELLFKNFTKTTLEEQKLIWSWRNSDRIRLKMRHQEIIPLENHLKFIEGLRKRTDCLYYLFYADGRPVGVQDYLQIENFDADKQVLEIGYLFERGFWHKGYATEAARACKKYAFEKLKCDEVCSIIRDTNVASQNVALRNGMKKVDEWVKHYKGVDMPHYRFIVTKADYENGKTQ